jgi:hypothetical protein
MQRLTIDPALESVPDYTTAAYDFIRTTLVEGQWLSVEAAIAELTRAWTANIEAKKV